MLEFLGIVALAAALTTGFVAIGIYVHPVAALLAFCVVVVVVGTTFDLRGD